MKVFINILSVTVTP